MRKRRRAPIILASASPTRRRMLRNAGIDCGFARPDVDESKIKNAIKSQGGSAKELALALACFKALAVSRKRPEALVIGADQVLDRGGNWFDKPEDIAGARRQLLALRGKTHRLISAVAVARGGRVIWKKVDAARLRMRGFSAAFLNAYIAKSGKRLLGSVGAYQVEGPGIQLFAAIKGAQATIMGIPLLPLLDFLRRRGALER